MNRSTGPVRILLILGVLMVLISIPLGSQAAESVAHVTAKGIKLPRLFTWMGNFHPSVVHFPIALILVAAAAEWVRLLIGIPWLRDGAYLCLLVGCSFALVATFLGWMNGGLRLQDPDIVLTIHRWLGTTTALFAAVLLPVAIRERSNNAIQPSRLFLTLLSITATLVGATGFMGGSVVYGLDHLAW